jgi:hypothetical protein
VALAPFTHPDRREHNQAGAMQKIAKPLAWTLWLLTLAVAATGIITSDICQLRDPTACPADGYELAYELRLPTTSP